jgi:tetratricopeptide (TPR) repeat protein
LAELKIKQESYNKAEELLQECLMIRSKKLVKNDMLISLTKNSLGYCLTKLKRYQKAEKILLESYFSITEKTDDTSKDVISVKRHIIELYKTWGKFDKADEFKALLPDSVDISI